MKLGIINGPNLNLLGTRQPEIYGTTSFDEYLERIQIKYPSIDLEYFQSNHEGEIIDKIQVFGEQKRGLIFNAGGYTHTSVAIADAVAAIIIPTIEVHISQPASREPERHHSLLSKYCLGTISGLGLQSYELAIQYFKHSI